MELRLLESDKKSMTVEILDVDLTLINPLVEELLADPKVETAMYKPGHPALDNPTLYIQVKSGKPETVLKKAAKNLGTTFKDLRDIMGSQMDKL